MNLQILPAVYRAAQVGFQPLPLPDVDDADPGESPRPRQPDQERQHPEVKIDLEERVSSDTLRALRVLEAYG